MVLARHLSLSLISTTVLAATLRVPSDYTTIQEAIDSASSGDSVLVAPGIHAGSVEIGEVDLTLLGDATPELVTIQGDSASPVVTVTSNVGLIIESLTLTGGHNDNSGGGVRAEAGATLTLANCVVAGNSSAKLGGGLYLNGANALIEDSIVEMNLAESGGGLYAAAADTLILHRTTIRDNSATNGGGIKILNGGSAWIEDSTLEGNSAEQNGAGMVANDAGSVSISGTTFSNNMASLSGNDASGGGAAFFGSTVANIAGSSFSGNLARSGAGIRAIGGAQVDLVDCEFVANKAGDDVFWGFGGGVNYWDDASGQISNCNFEQNTASREGGAIHVHEADVVMADLLVCDNICLSSEPQTGWGGGIFIFTTFSQIVDSHICRNSTTRGGGGIYSQGDPFAGGPRPTGTLIARNLIEENTAEAGGGIESAIYDSLWIEDNVIRNNTADRKGGIGIDAGSVADVCFNTIEGNTALSAITPQGGAGLFTSGSVVRIAGNTFRDNSGSSGHGGAIRVTSADAQVTIRDNVFERNNADHGGGVFCDTNANFLIKRNLFVSNAAVGEGGAILLASPCTGEIDDNTIVDSSVGGSRAAAVSYMGFCNADFRRNIVVGTVGGWGLRTTEDQSSNALERNLFRNNELGSSRGPTDLVFKINAAPEFVAGDTIYQLSPESLAIDTGGEDSLGVLLDLGWMAYAYPDEPRVGVSIADAPDTVSPGDLAQATLSAVNAATELHDVELTMRVGGNRSGYLGSPFSVQVAAGDTVEVPVQVRVPDPCGGCAGAVVLTVRARVQGALEAGDARDVWVE